MDLKKSHEFVLKNAPQQSRGRRTIQTILTATADLLGEVGFEQLSTNLICKKANLTPPALYHYFHDKYDVVRALGDTLFQEILDELVAWNQRTPPNATADDLKALLSMMASQIRQFPAGPAILRSLQASPQLAEMRQEAVAALSEVLSQRISQYHPEAHGEDVRLRMRLAVVTGFATLDLVFQDPSIDAQDAFKFAAETFETHLNSLYT